MPELFLVPKSAPRESPQEADAAARNDALNIRQSWIVEAPAGSGKTGLLIQRYLKLLADESVSEPEQVLAITFTTKATAEMRERVLTQLQSARLQSTAERPAPAKVFDRASRELAETVLIRDRARGWSLLDQPGRLNIRTIDSVCSEIANSLPILSGSGGRRSPVEDAASLYALAARRTFLELGGPDRELHEALSTLLLHRDANLAECEALLSQMLSLREQWRAFIPAGRASLDDEWLDANILPRLERSLDQTICAALTELAELIPADLLTQLTEAAAELAHLDGYKGQTSPIAVCAGRFQSPAATAEDLEHWRALIHLLITQEKTWRKGFNRDHLKFIPGKQDKATLSAIVSSLRANGQLLDAICKVGSLPPAKYPPEQWAVAKALFRILNRALLELKLVFAERGQCDFAEVSLAAHIALAAHADSDESTEPALESALGFRLQHLLVDEMQDTSSSQYELIETLTRNWDGQTQTVFLVGDPKQSIYLFRQARVERFLHTMRSGQLGDLPLGTLRLTANFRSQAALVDDFNSDFSGIFPAESETLRPDDVPYVFAHSARVSSTSEVPQPASSRPDLPISYSLFGPLFDDLEAPSIATSHEELSSTGETGIDIAANASAAPRIWHTTTLPPKGDPLEKTCNSRSQRLADAREICRIVDSWRSRTLPPGRTEPWRLAVLCRSRSHLGEIVAAFKAAAIPFRAVDIDPLKDRPEVQDLVALTRALLHPADRVAWLAVLRAPWCGLSLSELLTLAGTDLDASASAERSMQHIVAERGHLLPDEACQRLQRAWPALKAAVEVRARLPLAQLVERAWRSLGGNSYLDASELVNATRYLQLLNEIDAEVEAGFTTLGLSLLERRLDRLYAAPALDLDAVDILTIHKSKGLEWDVVMVPALERIPPQPGRRLLNWAELSGSDERSANLQLAPIAGKGEDSHELTKWIKDIDCTREAAERKRLFYVACTRAKEELHLFAALRRSAKGGIKPAPTSLLNAAWPAAEPYFSRAESATNAIFLAASSNPDFDGDSQHVGEDQESSEADIANEWDGEVVHDQDQLVLPVSSYNAPLKRLPLTFDPASQFRNENPLTCASPPEALAAPRFERPEGSLAARAVGNAVHAFLQQITEQITQRLHAGEIAASILTALPTWTPRITAIIRSKGLPPSIVDRLTQRVLLALENTLKDPTGIWLLSPQAGAATEYALTAWAPQRSNIRIDRIFRAGAEPLHPGTDHLWIVDYKTTDHGSSGLDAFLDGEKAKYAPQLEAYAAVLSQTANAPTAICVALYYPLLAKLIWWPWP